MTADPSVFTAADARFMAEALTLAERGVATTTPNPRVGCLIVSGDEVVGRGYHARAGEPHAEVFALRQAGARAHGATAYITLEPCAHTGRTAACAPQLVEAGVARVVSAMQDPDPRVAGEGHAILREHGIVVQSGLMAEAARRLNRGFLARVERQRPFVTLKLAQSLDGRTALANGDSKWITGPEARRDVQFLRARQSAILTGIDTVLTDDARLNVRLSPGELGIEGAVRQPVRVVLDSGLRLPPFAPLFDVDGPVWVYTRDPAQGIHHDGLTARGVRMIRAPHVGHGLDIDPILSDLAHRGINDLLVEAGPKLAGTFVDGGWVDELIVYQAPLTLGHDAKPSLVLPPLERLGTARRWRIVDSRAVGPDWRFTYQPEPA